MALQLTAQVPKTLYMFNTCTMNGGMDLYEGFDIWAKKEHI